MISKRFLLLILIYVLMSTGCDAQTSRNLVNYDIALDYLMDSMDVSNEALSILIDKSDYTLSVLVDTIILKTYPVVFGGNPVHDKLREGDQCTPEGSFSIVSKYPHKTWSKFIWIDYPNESSWKKHNKAKAEGIIAPDSKIGGEIGIHGVPEGYDYAIDLKQNWTLGCISLKNKDVDEVYHAIDDQCIITIRK